MTQQNHSNQNRRSQTGIERIPARQAAKRYLKHREDEVTQKTVKGQSTPVNRFARWIDNENKTLAELNGFDLQDFYDHLKEDGYKKVTLRNYMTAVRQFLRYLERLDAAPPGIADKVHRPTLEKGDRRRDEEIRPERVKETVEHLHRFHYASRDHVILLILWRCGIRNGSLYSLDLEDFTDLEEAGPVLQLRHRPETGTPLKNKKDGERPVNLRDRTAQVLQDYIDHNRIDTTDEYGREPFLTSYKDRYSKDQITKTVQYWTCPKNTDIGESCSCSEGRIKENAFKCDRSRGPHCVRSASITYWRQNDIPIEVVSDRMNVEQDVIEQHYDRRTEEGKARQRKKYLDSV